MTLACLACPYCTVRWPPLPAYRVCPRCREATNPGLAPPIPIEDARRMESQAKFGWWLWDSQRIA